MFFLNEISTITLIAKEHFQPKQIQFSFIFKNKNNSLTEKDKLFCVFSIL